MLRELTRIIPELIFLLDYKPFLTILLSREQGSTDKDLTHKAWHGTEEPDPWPTLTADAVSAHHSRMPDKERVLLFEETALAFYLSTPQILDPDQRTVEWADLRFN